MLAELDDWWLPAVLTDIQRLNNKLNPPQVLMRLHNVDDYQRLGDRIQDCGELQLKQKPILLLDEAGLNRGGDPLVEVLAGLGEQGYRLALDRFGLGNTSYRRLLRLPLAWVKLDPTLVDGALIREADGTLIYNIVNLAHSLNIRVIAANIGSKELFWLMCNVGCDLGEGEAFMPAQPIQSFVEMLAEMPSQRIRRVLG
jgi:EAL domain-containing protein (putative c-di-GMP-specific phosphodiesterase class I)